MQTVDIRPSDVPSASSNLSSELQKTFIISQPTGLLQPIIAINQNAPALKPSPTIRPTDSSLELLSRVVKNFLVVRARLQEHSLDPEPLGVFQDLLGSFRRRHDTQACCFRIGQLADRGNGCEWRALSDCPDGDARALGVDGCDWETAGHVPLKDWAIVRIGSRGQTVGLLL